MTFITIKQATQTYGKSIKTIRRLIYDILAEEGSEYRRHVQPDDKTLAELRQSKRPFSYQISTELLDQLYGSPNQPEQGTEPEPSGSEQAIKEIYEARIADLKEQLHSAQTREKELLDRAQQDKRMFADVAGKLSQMLPAFTETTSQPPTVNGNEVNPPKQTQTTETSGSQATKSKPSTASQKNTRKTGNKKNQNLTLAQRTKRWFSRR